MKTVMERFLNYVTYDTQSNPTAQTTPSTPSQLAFGDILVQELKEIGLTQVEKDEKRKHKLGESLSILLKKRNRMAVTGRSL